VRQFLASQWDRLVDIPLGLFALLCGYILVLDSIYITTYPRWDMTYQITIHGATIVPRPDEVDWMWPWLVPALWVVGLLIIARVAYTVWLYRHDFIDPPDAVDGFLITQWRGITQAVLYLVTGFLVWLFLCVVVYFETPGFLSEFGVLDTFWTLEHSLLTCGFVGVFMGLAFVVAAHYYHYRQKGRCTSCGVMTINGTDDEFVCLDCQQASHRAHAEAEQSAQAQALADQAEAALAAEPTLECNVCGEPMGKDWVTTDGGDVVIYHRCPYDGTEVYPHRRREQVIEYVDL
jgi:hypothetical protein